MFIKKRKKYNRIIHLGYNCEGAYHFFKNYGFVESNLYTWSYFDNFQILINALKSFRQTGINGFTFDEKMKLYTCISTGVRFHGRTPNYEYTDENKSTIIERDSKELSQRLDYLKQKFSKILNEENNLFVYKFNQKDFNKKDFLLKAETLKKVLETICTKPFSLLIVVKKDWNKDENLSQNIYTRTVKNFAPEENVMYNKDNDYAGWKKIYKEFAPKRILKKSKTFKFEQCIDNPPKLKKNKKYSLFSVKTNGKYIKIHIWKLRLFKVHKLKVLSKFLNYFYLKDFEKYIRETGCNPSKDFVDTYEGMFDSSKNSTKLISFYLPQFHSVEINDKNFEKGFCEWTNVTKAIPHFIGHHQPQLPIDTGFYNLEDTGVMHRQIELAKKYGVFGFCFHYYWFSGKRLLEKPLFNWLNDKSLNLPFCLCWANENWSKRWDGGNKEVIMEQSLMDNDSEKFFYDILPFFKDERYIKIDNKPLLIIYNKNIFGREKMTNFNDTIRKLAVREGLDGIYILSSNAFSNVNLSQDDFDGVVEFPPHCMPDIKSVYLNGYVNPQFKGRVYDMKDYIENKKYIYNTNCNLFKTVFPSWDNTARRAYSGCGVYFGETPELYKQWLKDCIEISKTDKDLKERFVFINAWNEWAEGAHLEPDRKYGYAYLKATKEALEETI